MLRKLIISINTQNEDVCKRNVRLNGLSDLREFQTMFFFVKNANELLSRLSDFDKSEKDKGQDNFSKDIEVIICDGCVPSGMLSSGLSYRTAISHVKTWLHDSKHYKCPTQFPCT